MNILGLDTSTEACTAALGMDDVITERFELGGRHAERLLVMVDELLAEANITLAQIDAIAFGRGPGSFTGVRIATGVAQGLAFGANRPVIPVSSLAAIAQGVNAEKILAAMDARMEQVYWGAFKRGPDGVVEPVDEERVTDPGKIPVPNDMGWTGAGSGWGAYHALLSARLGNCLEGWRENAYPRGRSIVELGVAGLAHGVAVSPENALPVYLRNDVAAKAASTAKVR